MFIDFSRFLKENMLQRWLTSTGFWGPWMSCYSQAIFCTFGICAHWEGAGGVSKPLLAQPAAVKIVKGSRQWWSMAVKDHIGTQFFGKSHQSRIPSSRTSKMPISNLENAYLEMGISNLTSSRLGTLKSRLSDKKSS